MLTSMLGRIVSTVDCSPWGGAAGRGIVTAHRAPARHTPPLYTPDEKLRRDASAWTFVQGVLAPLQFAVFLLSLGFVLRYLGTGLGEHEATLSVVAKTLVLYLIMVTGSIWEKEVFGRWLFAPAFWWEDAFSMVVLALHTLYIAALFTGALSTQGLMLLALAAYATYVVNAAQFIIKLRAARKQECRWVPAQAGFGGVQA